MNKLKLRDAILLDTTIQSLATSNNVKKNAVDMYIDLAVQEIATAHGWGFSTDEVVTATVANQQEYTLTGNSNDCHGVINIRYGTEGTDEITLEKLSPLGKDAFMSGRTVTGVGYWVSDGHASGGYPKVKLYATPETVKPLTYRYWRSNIELGDIPDQFQYVIVSCVIKRMVPGFDRQYEKDLKRMISQYDVGGNEPLIVKRDPTARKNNNRRTGLNGWS